MSYLTEENLANILDIPVSLPVTEIKAADWIVVATIQVSGSQMLQFRLLNLHLVGALVGGIPLALNDHCNPVTIKRINSSYGVAYIGIAKNYSGADDPTTITWQGTSADIISATSEGVYVRDLAAATLSLTDPGNYSFVLVNNCEASLTDSSSSQTYNVDLRLCVAGQARLKL